MATTTATITISSTDLLTDELSLVSTATLTTAGTSTGITQASGLSRKTTTSASAYTVYAAADYADNKAAKVYLKCINTEAARYVVITHGTTAIGRLYAGDWALIPWDGAGDFKLTPGQADSTTMEFMLVHEG